MKKFKLFRLLVLGLVLITSIPQIWADVHLYNGYVKIRFNGDMKFDGTYYEMYSGGPNASVGTAAQLGTLTGELKVTDIKMKINTNYETKSSKHTMWYNIDGSNTNKGDYTINWGKSNGDGYPEHTSWNNTVATNTDPSGYHSLNVGFYSDFEHGSGWEARQELKTYYFSYTVMPPAVDTIYVTGTGALAGDGSLENPYIVEYGGSLQIDITDADQVHEDPNSSAEYSVDNSNWGTETTNTSKTITNINSTDVANWMVYARFHNGTASLTGEQKGRRVYYKAESRYNITATASPATGGTVTPATATLAGQYSGGDITASPYIGYKFNGWTRTSGNGTFVSTSSEETKFKPTAVSTVQAGFVRRYGFIEGRFKVKNAARNSTTYVDNDGVWRTSVTSISMDYDDTNHRFYKHTYCTPAELAELIGTQSGDGNKNPYFFISASTASASVTSPVEYWAPSNTSNADKLLANGESGKKAVSTSATYSFTFMGNEDESGYAVIYCNKDYIWYELEQTLNYASNGGSGAAPAETYHMKNSTTSAAAANTFTAPTGYHFDHWAGSNSTNYNAGATVTMSANLTLTAQWAKNNFTVTFNANGGDGEMDDQAFEYSTTQYLTANAFTKDGYYFVGWATDAEEDASIQNRANGSTLTTENNGTVELFAKWKAVASIASDCWDEELGYTCGDIADLSTPDPSVTTTTWSSAAWGGSQTPTINSQVVIPEGVEITVNVTNAKAKEVILGSGATLTIEEGKELVIAKTLTKGGAATGVNDVVINSTLDGGLGALVIGENDGTNKASVNFATRSHGSSGSSASVNQYLGTLYSGGTVLNTFYNSWVYKLGDSGHGWTRLNGSDILTPFKGYAVISADAAGHVYENDGTLVSSENRELSLNYSGKEETENMLANSWTAPMLITGFDIDDSDEETDFYNVDPTIYIFNSGSKDNVKALRDAGTAEEGESLTSPGQWIVLPIGSSPWVSPTVTVIPAMQSFSVYATGASPKIKLNYQRLVYNPAVNGTAAVVGNRAPKRVSAEDPEVMKVIVEGESGYRDHTVLLAREDFTDGYDAAWDGRKVYGTSAAPQLYAMSEDGEMAVNCSPELDGTILCFEKGNEDSQYTFMFTYDGDETLYLNDVKDQTSTLISEENTYSFTSAEGDKEARFVISKTPIHNMPTGIETVSESAKARKQMIHGTLYIVHDGRIYNAEGALVK